MKKIFLFLSILIISFVFINKQNNVKAEPIIVAPEDQYNVVFNLVNLYSDHYAFISSDIPTFGERYHFFYLPVSGWHTFNRGIDDAEASQFIFYDSNDNVISYTLLSSIDNSFLEWYLIQFPKNTAYYAIIIAQTFSTPPSGYYAFFNEDSIITSLGGIAKATLDYKMAYNNGKDAGIDEGKKIGYQEGYDAGKIDGIAENGELGEEQNALLTFTGSILGAIGNFILFLLMEISIFGINGAFIIITITGMIAVIFILKLVF